MKFLHFGCAIMVVIIDPYTTIRWYTELLETLAGIEFGDMAKRLSNFDRTCRCVVPGDICCNAIG